MRIVILVVVLATGCVAAGQRSLPRPTTGALAGLARDHDSGDPIANAEVRITSEDRRERVTTSRDNGRYDFDKVAPGRYRLSATFAGQPITVTNVVVRAGDVSLVDLTFTLGRPAPIEIDLEGPKLGAIDRFRPRSIEHSVAEIEGTVNDEATRLRVSGVVVTAVVGNDPGTTQQTISDDHGRYRFVDLIPGTYSVSTYYTIGDRGTIEVRRMGIDVAPAEAVIVPLWVELER